MHLRNDVFLKVREDATSRYIFTLTDTIFLRLSFLEMDISRKQYITYFDVMQNISKISALLLAIFLSPILVGIRGEFLENFDEVKRPVLLVVGGEITTEFEYHGECLTRRQAYIEVWRFQQFAQSIERAGG